MIHLQLYGSKGTYRLYERIVSRVNLSRSNPLDRNVQLVQVVRYLRARSSCQDTKLPFFPRAINITLMLRELHEKEKSGQLFGIVVMKLINDDVIEQRKEVIEQCGTVETAIAEEHRVVEDIRVDDIQGSTLRKIIIHLTGIIQNRVQRSPSS